jgi:hypothetical protein
MLDAVIICTFGGIVLYSKEFVQLYKDPIAAYISQVLIEKRPLRDGLIDIDSYSLCANVDSDRGVITIACWQKSLKLTYAYELVQLLGKAIVKLGLVAMAIDEGNFDQVQKVFDGEFSRILDSVEIRDRQVFSPSTYLVFLHR